MTIQELTPAQQQGLRLAVEGIKSRVAKERDVLRIGSGDRDREPIRVALAIAEVIQNYPHVLLELTPEETTT